MNDLATAQLMNGDLAAAEANYKEALAIDITDLGEEHPETLSARENLGNAYFRSKRYDETLRNLDVVLALRRKALGADAEPVGRTLANMATVYKEAGRLEEAERAYREALAVLVPKLGEQNLDVASVRMSLGDTLRRLGQLDAAEPLMRSGLEVRAKLLGETHAATQRALKALADSSPPRGASPRRRRPTPPGSPRRGERTLRPHSTSRLNRSWTTDARPSFSTESATGSSGWRRRRSRSPVSVHASAGFPSTASTLAPERRPASSAGEPGVTRWTRRVRRSAPSARRNRPLMSCSRPSRTRAGPASTIR